MEWKQDTMCRWHPSGDTCTHCIVNITQWSDTPKKFLVFWEWYCNNVEDTDFTTFPTLDDAKNFIERMNSRIAEIGEEAFLEEYRKQ